MRLINATTYELEEFDRLGIPAYAILSHTWDAREVSLQEYCAQATATSDKREYAKIRQTCRLAREKELGYAWVDTCCIDKRSSAELTEAINSMFRWYKQAAVCFAYLSDMPSQSEIHSHTHDLSHYRWFRRGWTLQELLAPREVLFLDNEWVIRGNKVSFEKDISQGTHISPEVLRDSEEIKNQPVSVRMSWAASRETTRIEDAAYCLLGIFDVNMPLLYGEGHEAFTRLQYEIIKRNNDLSIFGWASLSHDFAFPTEFGNLQLGSYSVLASSPKLFTATWDGEKSLRTVEFSQTNMGIKIAGGLYVVCAGACPHPNCSCPAGDRKYFLPVHSDVHTGRFWGVLLEKLRPDLFVRSSLHLIHMTEAASKNAKPKASRPIYIATDGPYPQRSGLFIPQVGDLEEQNYSIITAAPQSRWHHGERGFFMDGIPNDQLWGLLKVKITYRDFKIDTFILIRYQHNNLVHILHDLHSQKREIVITMRDSSGWVWDDVQDVFEDELLSRKGDLKIHVSRIKVKRATLQVTATLREQLTIQIAEVSRNPFSRL